MAMLVRQHLEGPRSRIIGIVNNACRFGIRIHGDSTRFRMPAIYCADCVVETAWAARTTRRPLHDLRINDFGARRLTMCLPAKGQQIGYR